MYLDYNATFPLVDSVRNWFASDKCVFANSMSNHTSGKLAFTTVSEVSDFISQLFSLNEHYRLFFHSGGTEGVNTLLRGAADFAISNNKKLHLFSSKADHACVYNLKDRPWICFHTFNVDQNGDFDDQFVIQQIKNLGDVPVILNYTYVNNETGVVWDLARAEKIKEKTGCFVHVDAIQSPGKIFDWWKLNKSLDAYTFSGHKFGAFTGTGFSIVSNEFSFIPLMSGGGQQSGCRPGTENVIGIASMEIALRQLKDKINLKKTSIAKKFIEESILSILKGKGHIIAVDFPNKNLNTISFILNNVRNDILLAAFDIAGIDVSTGSACGSGLSKSNRVLTAMGYSEEDSKSVVRLSFAPDLNMSDAKDYFTRIKNVISRF